MLLGIVGGVSWASTQDYYARLCIRYNEIKGNLSSPEIVISSLDLQKYATYARGGDYSSLRNYVLEHGVERCSKSGCSFIIISSNTAHAVFNLAIERNHNILHIADCVAYEAKVKGLQDIAFFGTKYSMENDNLVVGRLKQHNLKIFTPDLEEDRDFIQILIEEDLSHNRITTRSKDYFIKVLKQMIEQHPSITGLILGCTEIGLAISQEDIDNNGLNITVLDSTVAHINCTLNILLEKNTINDFLPK